MDFAEWWATYVIAAGVESDECTPADIAGALIEAWMADAKADYRRRFVALMEASQLPEPADGMFLIDGLPVIVSSGLATRVGGRDDLQDLAATDPVGYAAQSHNDPADALGSLHALMIAADNQPLPKLNDLISDPAKISAILMMMSGHFRMQALRDDSTAELTDALTRGFQAVHTLWKNIPADHHSAANLKHPLAALIEGWLSRPTEVERNAKPTGILRTEHYGIREFVPPSTRVDPVGVGQVMLPGLEALLPDFNEMERFPILAMFDALQGSDKEAGLGLRLLVTVLTEINAQQSITVGDNGVLVPMLLRAIFGHLWPRGVPRGKHRLRAMQRLRAAMLGWNYAGIPDRGGLRRVIGTVGEWIALPDDYPLDDEVIFQVYLPPGATRGALIHRETMDYLGVSSGLMYRAMLTLAHQWWRATHTKGKGNDGVTRGTIWPYATRQVRLKDEAGNPIIRKGRTVPGDPNGEREPNPMIKYLPTYTDERILRLCYSPAQIDGAKRTRHLHTYQARAWAAVNEMEKVGLMEMGYHGVGLKLCPPLGWGVNFQMPESVKVLGKHRKSV